MMKSPIAKRYGICALTLFCVGLIAPFVLEAIDPVSEQLYTGLGGFTIMGAIFAATAAMTAEERFRDRDDHRRGFDVTPTKRPAEEVDDE